MVDWRLDEILDGLRDGRRLLGVTAFAEADIPSLLAERSTQGYESNYVSADCELSARYRILPVHLDHRAIFQSIRKAACDAALTGLLDKHLSDKCRARDLATLIEQEVVCIAQSRVVLWEHPWVDKMWGAYRIGGLPTGPWTFDPTQWLELGRTMN